MDRGWDKLRILINLHLTNLTASEFFMNEKGKVDMFLIFPLPLFIDTTCHCNGLCRKELLCFLVQICIQCGSFRQYSGSTTRTLYLN